MAKGIKPKPPKPKKCKCFPKKLIPHNSLQTACSPKCVIQLDNQLTGQSKAPGERESCDV